MIQKIYTTHPLKRAILLTIAGMCAGYTVSSYAQDHSTPQADNHHLNLTEEAETQSFTVPVVKFDPIVVTATRSNKYLSESPVAVQVLDKIKLEQNHAHTLKEALQLLPNVYLAQLHGKTGYEVRMQGFTGDQVLVLIDGLPVSASTGSSFNINQYLNTTIEQIEIIQGAASA
ncbi:TonB-dependent receptor plug domain-containing protein [Psychrobacter phenylpyruvicus]|uniref:Colicin I receptor n=1 Tax=Psychrobacter phenylpyruvicus TaxID=29432 RepID=A0A379LIT7_9GAMM|nr:TonB-dependent receptor plug domain-containing protein [Psychrobacter phenylpyruvicus]SUD90529.1 Colicin I receptor precursor [Psychrobacter phenylpyruvicus]